MFTMMSSMITAFLPLMIIVPFIRLIFGLFSGFGEVPERPREGVGLREEARKAIIHLTKETYEERYNELVERISEKGYSKPRVRRALDELIETLRVG